MKISHTDQHQPLQIRWSDKNSLWNTEVPDDCDSNYVPRSRFLHACCLLGQHLYLFGGKDGYTPLKDFWKLNIDSQEWTKIEITESVLPHLQGHTMVPHKSQIFIFGGTFYETVEESSLWIYNPDLNLMRIYSCEEHLPRPIGRREHTAVAHNNIMYVFGGFMDSNGSSGEFWAFDMETEQWREIPKSKPGPHHGHVAVTHSGCMWVHGGMRNLTYLSDLWMYNFALRTWKKMKGLGTCPALTGHTANVVYDNLIMVGGCRNGKPSSDVWIYNLCHNSWRCVETPKHAPFPSISLHKSVVIDPIKISHSGIQASTKSVPNLKTPTSVFPSQQIPPDIRPWTSPAPVCRSDPQTGSALDLQLSMLLDKNNNSEEDIKRISSEDLCLPKSHSVLPLEVITSEKRSEKKTPCQTDHHVQMNPRPKPDILKIRPASCEDCGDESPLLDRFHSVESDVDFGESNKIVTLSDEDLCFQSSDEVHKFDHSSCSLDIQSRSAIYELEDSYTEINAKEFKPQKSNTLCSNHHSAFKSSVTLCNKPVSLNTCSNQVFTEDVENVFTNPLYEKIYGENFEEVTSADLNCENVSTKVTNTTLQIKEIDRTQSSDLILEDLESCEDDVVLRSIKLPYPSNPLTHWSSLKNLNSSCDHLHDSNMYQQGHANSLEDLQSNAGSKASKYPKKLADLAHNAKGQQNKSSSHLRNIEEMRRLSRMSQRNSRVYVKHLTSFKINSIERKGMMSTEKQGLPQDLQPSQTPPSWSRNKSPATDSRNSYRCLNFQSRNDADIENIHCRDMNTSNSQWRIPYDVADEQQLVLMILGGQTEADMCDSKSLKMWNCYLF